MNFINSLKQTSKLKIDGSMYDVLAVYKCATDENMEEEYYKVTLSGSRVLVVSSQDTIYFGNEIGELKDIQSSLSYLKFQGNEYNLIAYGHQVVKQVVFGEDKYIEKDVEFWDFEFEDSIITIGIDNEQSKRCDVISKLITVADIEIN